MLDLYKAAQALAGALQDISVQHDAAYERAVSYAQQLFKEPDQQGTWYRYEGAPRFEGALQQVHAVALQPHPYSVIATDGSQIYPDKHLGIACAVINMGTAHFEYGQSSSKVQLRSEPTIMTERDYEQVTEEHIACLRAERELTTACDYARQRAGKGPQLVVADGALLYWHLEQKHPVIKQQYLGAYMRALESYYEHQVPIVAYSSLPRSRELVTLLERYAAHVDTAQVDLAGVYDTDLVGLFLKPFERTCLFEHTSSLAAAYSEHSVPHFMYLHVDSEIVRVEVPAWVARDEQLCERSIGIVCDQVKKGNGYPQVLSEAHEQAVIQGPDRQRFLTLLQRYQTGTRSAPLHSQKALKKRYVSV